MTLTMEDIVTYLDMMNITNREKIWTYIYKTDSTIEKLEQFSSVPIGSLTIEF